MPGRVKIRAAGTRCANRVAFPPSAARSARSRGQVRAGVDEEDLGERAVSERLERDAEPAARRASPLRRRSPSAWSRG